MRILTQNYWHVSGPSPKVKNKALANFCRQNDIDIICIQEGIGGIGNLIYGTSDSVRDLASMLGYDYQVTQSFPCRPWPRWISHYTVGIISRLPFTSQPVHLSVNKRTHLAAVIQDVIVCNVHIDPNDDTRAQIERVASMLPLYSTFVGRSKLIIAGDFNDIKAPEIVTNRIGTAEQPSLQAGQIDFILWKGFSHGTTYVTNLNISDHPLVWAILKP